MKYFALRVHLLALLLAIAVLAGAQPEKSLGRSPFWQGKEAWKGNNAMLKEFLNKIHYRPDSVYFRVPVQFWVYCYNNGEGAVSAHDIRDKMRELNEFYALNGTGIQFYALPVIEQINNTHFTEIRWDGEVYKVTRRYKRNGAVNVHLIDSIVKRKYGFTGKVVQTFRGLYNTATRGVMVKKETARSSLAHEVGHFFGLQHTHLGWKGKKNEHEPADTSRTIEYKGHKVLMSEITGDCLSDTPADPNLTWYTNDNCDYIADALRDPWGDAYKPQVSNIMGYPRNRACRTVFTPLQTAAMLYTAYGDKYYRNWLAQNFPVVPDDAEPDNQHKTAYSMPPDTSLQRSLHWYFDGNWHADADCFTWQTTAPESLRIQLQSSAPVQLWYAFNNGAEKQIQPNELLQTEAGTHYIRVVAQPATACTYSISRHTK